MNKLIKTILDIANDEKRSDKNKVTYIKEACVQELLKQGEI